MTPRPQPSEGERRAVTSPSAIKAFRAQRHRTVAQLDAEQRA